MDLNDLKLTCQIIKENENERKAEEFYFKEIFPEIKKIVRERAKEGNLVGKYKGIIFTTGFSPEPLILTITALKPKKVYFLYTRESEKHLDRIVEDCKLRPSQYDKAVIERSDGSDVYEKIKEIWNAWKSENIRKIAIDITGGTKPMVGGSAIAASILNAGLLYVDSKYGWILGKSEPGTERIVKLDNPFNVFGDLEEKKAIELFNGHNYILSVDYFGKLMGLTKDPRGYEVKQLLAKGYGAWDMFDYDEAYSKLNEALRKLGQYGLSYDSKIEKHLEILKVLRKNSKSNISFFSLLQDKEFSSRLTIDIFSNAKRRIEQGRYDDAIIRFYRVLELIAQRRLAIKNIDTSNIKIGNPEIQKEFEKHAERLYGSMRGISKKIGLMDSWILLLVLKDEIIKEYSEIEDIYEHINIRNNLMIEHRNLLGDKKKCSKLGNFTEKWLEKEIEGYKELIEEHTFIKLN